MSASELAKKKRICNAKAQAIVEKFIDGIESEISFLTELRWINQNHYQDIVEERAIMKTCGYPLCAQKLVHVPKKQYSIILSLNKVYDISQRKHFCSNQCYKASCFLKEQLLETPLWIRDSEPEPKFILLKSSKELLGDEVSFPVHRVSPSDAAVVSENDSPYVNSHETDHLETNETIQSTLKSTAEDHQVTHKSRNISETTDVTKSETQNIDTSFCPVDGAKISILKVPSSSKTSEELSTSAEISKIKCDFDTCDITNLDFHCNEDFSSSVPHTNETTRGDSIYSTKEMKIPVSTTECESVRSIIKCDVIDKNINIADANTRVRTSKKPSQIISEIASTSEREICKPSVAKNANELVLHVEKSLREWFTVDSLSYIIGFEKIKQLMLDKGKKLENLDMMKSDPYIHERYNALCKKLKILQLQEDKLQGDIMNYNIPSKPLPDFNVLREQTKEMEIKVQAFYRGDKKVMFQEKSNEAEENDRPNAVPLLHQHAKHSIRRNVVLDKLKTTVPAFASILELPNSDILDKIKRLAFTFKFSAHNIVFRTLEWNLIVLILIKLLSLQDFQLKEKLNNKSNYINAMLLNYKLENNYLDLVCTWLTNLDLILENQEFEYAENN